MLSSASELRRYQVTSGKLGRKKVGQPVAFHLLAEAYWQSQKARGEYSIRATSFVAENDQNFGGATHRPCSRIS